MLKHRIITAAILIPIVLAILFYASPPVFCILTAALVVLGAVEWTSLIPLHKLWMRFAYVFMMIFIMYGMLFMPIPFIFAAAFFWWMLALILVLIYPRGTSCWSKNKIIKAVMGIFVLLPCWVAVNYIRNDVDGIYVLLFVFVLIWGADTAAYFAGRKWGKTKLAPLVSPGKSVQGVIAALVYAAVISLGAGLVSGPPLIVLTSVVTLAVVTVCFSILGDLFESMLKREVGLKDSGNILPGHGGILDRIDSLTAAAPIYALGIMLLSVFFS